MADRSFLVRVVMFDLGGVVFPSPFPVLAGLEHQQGLPAATITRVIKRSGDDGAWAKLERGEISAEAFDDLFYQDSLRFGDGHAIRGGSMLNALSLSSFEGLISPLVGNLIHLLRTRFGLFTVALTNNWKGSFTPENVVKLNQLFDVVIQSCEVGARKPETRIYRHALQTVSKLPGCQDIQPAQIVFLDDIGSNLKPAQQLGMRTVHISPAQPLFDSLQPLTQIIPGLTIPLLSNL